MLQTPEIEIFKMAMSDKSTFPTYEGTVLIICFEEGR